MFTCCRDHTTLRDFTALRRHHPRNWHRVLQRSVRSLRSSQTVAQALRGGGGGLLLARRSTRAEANRLKKLRHCARRLVAVYGDLPLQRITEDWLRLERQRQASGRHPISRSGDVVTAAFTLLRQLAYRAQPRDSAALPTGACPRSIAPCPRRPTPDPWRSRTPTSSGSSALGTLP